MRMILITGFDGMKLFEVLLTTTHLSSVENIDKLNLWG